MDIYYWNYIWEQRGTKNLLVRWRHHYNRLNGCKRNTTAARGNVATITSALASAFFFELSRTI